MRTHGMVTELLPNQVFVFGSNLQGFHGAGSAGFAMRGTSTNNWRDDTTFLKAMKSPVGSPHRIGKRAVYGVSEGYMRGTEGMSYAIPTVSRAGKKRSITLREIYKSLLKFADFARENPDLDFILCITGGGYNGYTIEEMKKVYTYWHSKHGIPENVIIPQEMV